MEKPPTLAGGAGAFPGGQYVCIETTTSVIIYYIGHVDKLTGPKSPLLVANVLPYTCRESTPTAKRDFGGLGVLFFLGIRATKAQNIDERRNGIMTEADNRDTKKAPAATGAGAETDAGAAVSYPHFTMPAGGCQAPMLAQALAYAARGWYVFPVGPDKKPRCAHGYKDAATDPDAIRRMWQNHPGALIGCDCGRSGLVVPDLDVKGGLDGIAEYENLGIVGDPL